MSTTFYHMSWNDNQLEEIKLQNKIMFECFNKVLSYNTNINSFLKLYFHIGILKSIQQILQLNVHT